MATSKQTTTSGGVGLMGLLFLVFLTLKLAEVGAVATWSWWWVTAPLWAPLGALLVFMALMFVVLVAKDILTPKGKR